MRPHLDGLQWLWNARRDVVAFLGLPDCARRIGDAERRHRAWAHYMDDPVVLELSRLQRRNREVLQAARPALTNPLVRAMMVSMSIPFHKMQGAGNDFIVVRGNEEIEHDWSALAPALCDRRKGMGADGILVALPSEKADLRMRMFNVDGTEDECGNGLRCIVLYAYHLGLVSGRDFTVETLTGVRACAVLKTEGTPLVRTELGRADLRPSAVPVKWPEGNALGFPLRIGMEELEAFSLSMGTAHTVFFEMPDEARFQRLSPRIEVHRLFPERTSILWTRIQDRERARVRIWERGVGETLACGTGAAAVAVAGYVTERTGPRIEVTSRGGTLTVEVSDDLEINLTGPAEFVFEGEWLG